MPEESGTPDLVELTRRTIEAGSYEEWAMLAEPLYAPDAVWVVGGMIGSLEGFAAIRAFVEDYWLMWHDHHHYADEIVDLGNGVMYAVIREEGRMKDSESPVQARHASVILSVDGRVVKAAEYTDIDEARAVAERLAEDRA